MKLTKKQQQFIKDAYDNNDVCSEWKNKIKENFPKLFKETELEVGKWYKYDDTQGHLLCIDEVCQDKFVRAYGFYYNKWRNIDYDRYIKIGLKPATKEEVEQFLIAEAKKRGFKKDVIVDNSKLPSVSWAQNGMPITYDDFNFYYPKNRLKLGEKWIFEDGVWAEIIETITKEQAEKELGKKIV